MHLNLILWSVKKQTAVVSEEDRQLHLFQVQEHLVQRGKRIAPPIMSSQDSLEEGKMDNWFINSEYPSSFI